MSYQTAAGARAAFEAKLKTVSGLEDVIADLVEPQDLPDGVFATLQEGRDVTLDTLIGATRPLYEVYSEVTLDFMTRLSDKAKETVLRAATIDALETDPTLGGAIDDVLILGADNDVFAEPGAESARATQIRIQLHYTSTSPVG